MSKPKIFIAGHKGMVGSALVRLLKRKKVEIITKEKKELNLLDQKKVRTFFKNNKIDQVYLVAAKVGGIHANNTYPAEFIYENLMIQNNVIHSAFLSGVKKLLFLGSSCIYPKNAKQPMKEEELLTGKLEPTNEPGDNYHPDNSHVVPGLIRRFHEAKVNNLKFVTIWGTGSPLREFLHVEDMARASIQIMNIDKKKYNKIIKPISHINIGSGKDVTIK